MTERLYYSDAYLRTFEARVIERLEVDGRPAVILDRTAFYPEGGGQPSDRGVLNRANVKFVTGAELEQYVREQGVKKIFVDTETTGLDPFSDQLALIQIAVGDQVFFLKPEEDLRTILEDSSILKIFHNAKFDLQFLNCHVEPLFDTYLAERLLTAGIKPLRELSLKDLAKKYLGVDLDKSLRTSFQPGQQLTQEQVEYAAQDVQVLEPIFQAQKAKLKAQGLIKTSLLEFSIVQVQEEIDEPVHEVHARSRGGPAPAGVNVYSTLSSREGRFTRSEPVPLPGSRPRARRAGP